MDTHFLTKRIKYYIIAYKYTDKIKTHDYGN